MDIGKTRQHHPAYYIVMVDRVTDSWVEFGDNPHSLGSDRCLVDGSKPGQVLPDL